MRHDLAGLFQRQPVIHCAIQVIGDLRDLPRRNESAYGNKRLRSRGANSGRSQKYRVQHVRRVLNEP